MWKIGGQRVPKWTLLLIVSDAILIIIGLMTGILLRFLNLRMALNYLHEPHTVSRFALVVGASGLALYYNDLYSAHVFSRRTELLVQLIQALGISCVALAIIYYFAPDSSLGRGIAVIAAPAILLLTLSWRMLSTDLMLRGPERVLVVGTSLAGISLVRDIIARPELNLKVVGFLDEKGENIGKSLVNPGIIGAVSDVETIVASQNISRVVLSLAERRGKTPVRELLQLKFAGVGVEDTHSFNEKIMGRIPLENLSPSWLILSEGFRKSKLLLLIKRISDFTIALIGMIITLPVMAVVSAAIRLESGGPILFRQERVGMGGRPFRILKFRSMCQDAEQGGPSWATDGDPRITRVGRFLRKFRLDELPQLINVFRGEMSLVGPRPERPYFCQLLEQTVPYYMLRNSVRPGVTGWAQIRYQYGGSIEEAKRKLEYDLFYIKHMSFMLDLAIYFGTAKVVLCGRGAK
jgi:sugar transferase (PEP-CTERM system associated)